MNQNKRNSHQYTSVLFAGLFLVASSWAYAIDTGVTQCDTLAGNPNDPNKVAEGVAYNKINTTLAVPACLDAVTNNPTNPRLQYEYGRALDANKDYSAAFTWYSKAVDQNYAPAQDALGTLYYYGDGVEKNLIKSFELTLKAANQNYAPAQDNVGLAYKYGDGVELNLTNAFEWFTKSANQNFAPAQNDLGLAYEYGEGVEKSVSKAFEWYQKSANQNYDWGQHNLGVFYYYGNSIVADKAKAFEWFQKAADQNNASAQNWVGLFYYRSSDSLLAGIKQDLNKAFEWFQKSADGGDTYGLLNLGMMYHNGKIIAKNEPKALAQWRKASELGLTDAGVELIFSWGEAVYPAQLPGFAESLPASLPAPYDHYQYRHYTAGGNDIYVAYNPDNNHLYYLGPTTGNKVVDLGVMNPFLNLALDYEKTINP